MRVLQRVAYGSCHVFQVLANGLALARDSGGFPHDEREGDKRGKDDGANIERRFERSGSQKPSDKGGYG